MKIGLDKNRIGRKALDQNPLDENWVHMFKDICRVFIDFREYLYIIDKNIYLIFIVLSLSRIIYKLVLSAFFIIMEGSLLNSLMNSYCFLVKISLVRSRISFAPKRSNSHLKSSSLWTNTFFDFSKLC